MEDGGSWKSHDKNPAQDAAQRNNLPWNGPRHHVTVTYGCHGNDRPPVRGGNAAEIMGACKLTFRKVDERREKGDSYAEEKKKEAKLPGAAPDRQPQHL